MRNTILLLAAVCLAPLAVFAGGADSTESDVTAGRPCDARNVVLAGSLSITHKSGEGYGGEGFTEGSFDGHVSVFVIDHFAVGVIATVQDNSPWDDWDQWSIGPVIGFYVDPMSDHPAVSGSVLPFLRLLGQIGTTDVNHGGTSHRIGGDLGIAIMAGGKLSIDIALRVLREWRSDAWLMGGDPFGYSYWYRGDAELTTVRLSVGLSGFIH